MSFAVTAAVATVAGAVISYQGSRKAGKAAEAAGQAEAETERAVTQERLRQIEREEMLLREQTIAGTAGQNIKVDSRSALEVLADQASEFRREREITTEVGASKAQASLTRASALATQYKYQGYSALFSGLTGAAGIGHDAGWFGGGKT